MKYLEMMYKEMDEILKEMEPHFNMYGKLKRVRDKIFFNGKIICIFHGNGIHNNWYVSYENLPFEASDVFEKVGYDVKEAKIKKPRKKFIKWKK